MQVVLVEPEIPQNTGNIARTCAATGTVLHLIEPMGFSVDEKQVKRAGLDYWHLVDVRVHSCLQVFLDTCDIVNAFFLSTKAQMPHTQAAFTHESILFFGKETKGLPESLLEAHAGRCFRIPMREGARSLNLANSVAVVLYEALRQTGYNGLK